MIRLIHFMKPGILNTAILLGIGCSMVAGCQSQATKNPLESQSTSDEQSGKYQADGSGGDVSRPEVGKDVQLRDVTTAAAIDFTYHNGREAGHNAILESLGGGTAVLDYDLDGQLDVFFTGGGKYKDKKILGLPSALYRHADGLTFSPVTQEADLGGDQLFTHGCHAGDFDNDGFPDLLVTGYGKLLLFHNQGDGTFLEIAQQAKLDNSLWSTSAGWGDFNADGLLDLYVCNYVNWSFANHPHCAGTDVGTTEICPPKQFDPLPDAIYYNNGDGTFRNAAKEAGLRIDGKGLGVMLADVNLDGHLDIYVANDTTDNFLYLNDGKGVFKEVGLLHSVALDNSGAPNGSMGVDVGDYNGDGMPDLWVANYEQESFALYENVGKGTFLHVSDKAGVTALGGLFVGFGTAFLDVDFDGDEDLIVINGHVINFPPSGRVRQLPLLLINEKQRRFVRKQFAEDQYFAQRHRGRGLALADMNNDGSQDLLVSNSFEPVAFLVNETKNANRWLRVRLIGRQGNRDAVGARLLLHTSVGDQLRMVKGGGSYLSHSDLRVTWGVASGVDVTGLTIYWPNGEVQKITDLTMSQTMTLLEPLKIVTSP
ncbi:MAG: CRTAC1 family protein [Pirellulaceae bacterium]|nr:CRTAC1 family protein [Pirellulaceae bacterium]